MNDQKPERTTDPRRQAPEEIPADWWAITLSSIGDAVITTNNDGDVVFLNPVAESVTGWTLTEATGMSLDNVFRIVNEGTRLTIENPAVRALRQGAVVGLANHTLLIAKDSTERPIDYSAAPIRNHKSEVAGVVVVFHDVTERRKAEKALQESEERFRLLVEGTRDYAIFMLDPQGNIATWNTGAERIKGYQAEEIIGKHFSCFYPQESVEAGWPERELKAAATEGRFEDEGWRLRKDGSRFWANVVITALRDQAGNLKGFSKITRDITERKRAEAEVKENELRYRRLFESAKDGILIVDAKTGKIIDANPFMSDLLGYSHDQFGGKELWQIGVLRDAEANRAVYQLLHDRGYVRYDHLPLQNKTGQSVDVEFVSNVYQENGRLVIQCNIRDITARRQWERAKALVEELADLHRRKDEFLAMLSHELRNPLAPIMNAVYILRLEQGNENPIQRQARTIIERQVGQLAQLVNDLLEVSRITTGRIKLHNENLDLRVIVDRAVETARPVIDQRKHVLIMLQPPEPIWLYGDPTRLEQVVVNLLTNAAKYTDTGGRIWLSLHRIGDEAMLRVRDTGIGIAPELLHRIFDLFTQAERSLERSQGGLGIGLTVVQKLVEMHQGKVEAFSALGQGSEFIVHLPVLPQSAPQPQPPSTETVKQPAHALRLLVVDDNVDAADSAALLLRRLGHEVRVAYSSESALEAADEFQPNIVLLDIGLPEIDGYEVARRLHQRPKLKDIRLIAMTGYGQESDHQHTQAAGFNAHLVKPVDPKKLQEVLAKMTAKM